MREYLPLVIVGAIIGAFTLVFLIASLALKKVKEEDDTDRHMKDSEIIRRLLRYARPHIGAFILVGVVMLLSISYDIVSPLLIADIEKLITSDFEMKDVIARINELAATNKTVGLNEEELAERDKLRRIYIDSYKASLVGQLENTYIVYPDGSKKKVERKN